LAFLLFGLLPALFVYPATLNAEIRVIALVTVVLWLAGREPSSGIWAGAGWAGGFGAICGLLALAKPEFFLWVPAAFLAARSRGASRYRAAALFFCSVVGFVLVLSPWIVRNLATFDRIIFFSTSGGRVFWLAAHKPELTEYSAPAFQEAYLRCHTRGRPKETDVCLQRDGLRMVSEHPMYYVQSAVKRVARVLFGSHTEQLVGYEISFAQAWASQQLGVLAVKGVLLAVHATFALSGIIGLFWARPERAWPVLVYLVATKLGVHAALFGTPRYGLHLAPIFAVTAAGLWVGFVQSAGPLLCRARLGFRQ
jgi:hypothetical protein